MRLEPFERHLVEPAVEGFDDGGDQAGFRSEAVIGQSHRNLRPFRHRLHFQMPMAADQLLFGRPEQSLACSDRGRHPEVQSLN
nr:hypothetical protein [Bradyrhizobium australiense]